MCHSFTTLAEEGPHRRVLRCSCGALHVVWHNFNLSLSGAEFAQFAALLAGAAAERGTLGDWHLHVTPQAVGLWYGPAGLTFSPADFGALRALVASVPPQPHVPPRPALHLN